MEPAADVRKGREADVALTDELLLQRAQSCRSIFYGMNAPIAADQTWATNDSLDPEPAVHALALATANRSPINPVYRPI
jgi:hypothetical protein